MTAFNRRRFIQAGGLSALAGLLPNTGRAATGTSGQQEFITKFYLDGEMFNAADYLALLTDYHQKNPFEKDRYGQGGVIRELEKAFETLTGKEQAMFMPSGTLANQLAIAVLSGNKSKVWVQENSHVFRDEADAAQSVFGKRLVPLARGRHFFTAEELRTSITDIHNAEVFETGFGAVSIENPVRRSDGRLVDIGVIRDIRAFCLEQHIPMHLDGARLFMASAWSGLPVQTYADLFDTVYISLYKYFGAAGGAMLCGSKEIMSQMTHLVKIHGGSMYGNWLNAAMALHRLQGFDNRLREARERSAALFRELNRMSGVRISALDSGTNMYQLQVSGIRGDVLAATLRDAYHIRLPRPDADGRAMLTVNETLLYHELPELVEAFSESLKKARQ